MDSDKKFDLDLLNWKRGAGDWNHFLNLQDRQLGLEKKEQTFLDLKQASVHH